MADVRETINLLILWPEEIFLSKNNLFGAQIYKNSIPALDLNQHRFMSTEVTRIVNSWEMKMKS